MDEPDFLITMQQEMFELILIKEPQGDDAFIISKVKVVALRSN